MSWFDNLKSMFTGRAPPREPRPDRVPEVVAEMEARARPCIRLAPGGDGRSRLGGLPQMTSDWPRSDGRALGFVAQLDLPTLRAVGGPDWLPAEGRLLVFYDFEHQPWGIEPSDLGTFVVRHEVGEAPLAQAPGDLHEDAQFPAYPVTYVQARSYAGWERLSVDWNSLSKQEDRELERMLDEQAPAEPAHQIGGYPAPIQADGMEDDCQRIVSSLFDAAMGAPQSRSEDWRLLLQVDSDNEVGFMWGDTGRIYIWVREQDARAGDFSKAWLILQCS